jgi:hypothetical protein
MKHTTMMMAGIRTRTMPRGPRKNAEDMPLKASASAISIPLHINVDTPNVVPAAIPPAT